MPRKSKNPVYQAKSDSQPSGQQSREPPWKRDAHSDQPLFFWKPDEPYGHFCQWYLSPITLDGHTFNCCEQYMMYSKAALFEDKASMTAILAEKNPRKQKMLGGKAKGFVADVWDREKYGIVLRVNLAKFREGWARDDHGFVYGEGGRKDGQDQVALNKLLLATGERELVEASRFDRIWGIGFDEVEATRRSKKEWGENLLGKVLMDVRKQLRLKEEGQDEGEKGDADAG